MSPRAPKRTADPAAPRTGDGSRASSRDNKGAGVPTYPGPATRAVVESLDGLEITAPDAVWALLVEWDAAGESARCEFDDKLGDAIRELTELRRRLGNRQWKRAEA